MTDHRIKRLSIDINASQHADVFAMRQKLTQQWQAILPLFEVVFDQLNVNDDFMHIPKLQLKLTLENGYDLDDLLQQLKQAIANYALKQSPESHSAINKETPYALAANSEHGQSILHWQPIDIITYYLTTGSLPWFVVHDEKIQQQLQHWLIDHYKHSLLAWLASTGIKQSHSLLRWLQLLPKSEFIQQIDQLLLLTDASTSIATEKKVLSLLLNEQLTTDSHHQFLTLTSILITLIFQTRLTSNNNDYLSEETPLSKQQQQQWRTVWQQNDSELGQFSSLLSKITTAINKKPIAEHNTIDAPQSDNIITLPSSASIQASTSYLTPETAKNKPTLIPVQLAGGILLYPYLKRLFAACHIDTKLISKQAKHRHKAAALLYFLITGNKHAQEYELGMIKVLLGLSSSSFLIVTPEQLDETDIDEAEKTLHLLINHWNKLKETSIEGLRTGFLNRNGYLQHHQDGTTLKLERLGYDILIDFLPFPLTVVKLPWMPSAIQVEW